MRRCSSYLRASRSQNLQRIPPPAAAFALSTYYAQPVRDAASQMQKLVQISDFYPIALSQCTAEIQFTASIASQSFDDSHAQLSHFCLADGQLCSMDEAEESAIVSPYCIGEDVALQYTLQLANHSAPFFGVTVCADRNLPQTETKWADWSKHSHFLHTDLLPSVADEEITTPAARANAQVDAFAPQCFAASPSEDNTPVLKLSDAAYDSLDFTESWRVQVSAGQMLYLYCKLPSASCSLLVLIDGIPAPIFDGAYGVDMDINTQGEGMRLQIPVPQLTKGTHDITLLLYDRVNSQIYGSAPILLQYGDAS